MTPPPPPPPLSVILAAIEGWTERLGEAIAETDAEERERKLEHVHNNMRNGIVTLKWYLGGGVR